MTRLPPRHASTAEVRLARWVHSCLLRRRGVTDALLFVAGLRGYGRATVTGTGRGALLLCRDGTGMRSIHSNGSGVWTPFMVGHPDASLSVKKIISSNLDSWNNITY